MLGTLEVRDELTLWLRLQSGGASGLYLIRLHEVSGILEHPTPSAENDWMLQRIKELPRPALVVLVTVAALPVVQSAALSRTFRTPQFVLLIIVLALAIGGGLRGSAKWISAATRPVRISIFAFAGALLLMTLAALAGPVVERSFMGHPFQSTGMLMWYASFALYLLTLRNRDSLRPVFPAAIAVSASVMVFMIGVWLVAPEDMERNLVPTQGGIPLPGMGSSWLMAAFTSIVIIVSLTKIFRSDLKPQRRLLWAALLMSSVVYLPLTQARVPIVVTGVATVTLVLTRNRRVLGAIVLVSLIAIAFLAQNLLLPRIFGRTDETSALHAGQFGEDAIASGVDFRIVVGQIAIRAMLEKPILGYGPANFTYAGREAMSREDAIALSSDVELQDAHNLLLEIAATAGLPAALLMGVAIVAGGLAWRGGGRNLLWIKLAALSLLALHMVEPLSLSATPLLFVLIALGARSGTPPSEPLQSHHPRVVRALLPVLVAASATVSATFIYSDFNLRHANTTFDSTAAEKAILFDPTCQQCLYRLSLIRGFEFKKEGKGTATFALEPARRAVVRRPRDSEAHLRLGQRLLFLERYRDAEKALLDAHRLYPHSAGTAAALAGTYLELGMPERALRFARESAEIEESATSYRLIAVAAERLGQHAEAADARKRAADLDKGRRPS